MMETCAADRRFQPARDVRFPCASACDERRAIVSVLANGVRKAGTRDRGRQARSGPGWKRKRPEYKVALSRTTGTGRGEGLPTVL
jgi:hypothetical protein